MDARRESETAPVKSPTKVERRSDRELVVTRTFNGPARLVFDAWTKPELLKRWWVPRSAPMTMVSCEVDAGVGGKYRFVFAMGGAEMAFFGKYLEVVPNARLVWTNEEEGDNGPVTTATFEEKDGKTLLTVHELHPSKEALDAARESGAETGAIEQHAQLDELLVALVPRG